MSLLVTMILALGGPGADPSALNTRVVEFARSKIGQKVGDGECSALAAEALRAAGAKVSRGSTGWGEPLPSLKDARPGDILQFENAVFVHTEFTPEGALLTVNFRFPHHTAIVTGVRKRRKGNLLTVLHQNAGVDGGSDAERKLVQQWVVNLAEQRKGTVKAYRPVPDDSRERTKGPGSPRD